MKGITIEEYQDFTFTTWEGSDNPLASEIRLVCGVGEEAGEILGKVKKWHRGDYGTDVDRFRADIEAEMGDLFWYANMLCNFYGIDVETVLEKNVEKLLSRKERGLIKGSGDDR